MMTLSRSDRHLWRLAWPLMLTNLTVPLLGLVDTAVLGHLESPEYLGAVAIGANLFSILYWSFGFMRMGTTGLAAQAFGRRDATGQTALLVRSPLLACAIALAVFLPAWWLTTSWGNHGLWFALIMLMLARASSMATVFMVRTRNSSWFRHD